MLAKCFIPLIVLLCGLATACTPVAQAQPQPQPEIQYVVEYAIERVIEYREVPVTVIKEVPVIKESILKVPVLLNDWSNVEELRQFLAEDDTESVLYLRAGDNGNVSLSGACEDYALQLRDRAMLKGKYLSVIALHPVEYRKWYGVEAEGKSYHAINMARIGNEFWYIEPQNDKCWLALYLD